MTTYVRPHQRTRASELKPEWHVLDAENKTLGRLASEIATLLQGKHRPIYVPYMNTGDFVVVVNAEKIRVTGDKLNQKMYYRHSGYHGGLKEQNLARLLETTPTRALKFAVKGMLPKNSVGRKMLARLKLYVGASHPHEAQVNAGRKAERAELARQARAEAEAAAPVAPVVDEVAAQPDAPAKPARKRTTRHKTAKTEEAAAVKGAEDDAPEIKLAKPRKPRTGAKSRAAKPRTTRARAPRATTEEAPQPSEEAAQTTEEA